MGSVAPAVGLGAFGKKIGGALGFSAFNDKQGAYASPEQAAQRRYMNALKDYTGQMEDAEQAVQGGAFTKDLFGQGGLQSRLGDEEKQLASQGFKLTPEDLTAYGQASGNISRQFGQQEQDITKSLARRGLASAGSGAAGALFAGAAGNKNEMLANAQMEIAQRRYQDTARRLQNVRSMMGNMADQGRTMQNDQYKMKIGALGDAASAEQGIYNQNRQALADQKAAVKPSLFKSFGQGLQTGITNLGSAAPGMAVGGMTGGAAGAAQGGQATMGGGMSSQPQWDSSSAMYGSNNPQMRGRYSLFSGEY